MLFFFKQKTAYEMRISDWSSDVCSSDLKIRSGQPAILELSFEDLAILDIGDRAQRKPEVITASVEWHLGSSNESVNRKMGFLEKFLRNQGIARSEEHTSELQSLMRISYAVFCLKKKKNK